MNPKRNNPNGFVCEDHKTTKPPKFMYCVNATIADNITDIPAVFFNEAMATLFGKSCVDLIKTHGYKDQKTTPPPILAAIGKPIDMMVTIKSNRTLTVNSVKETEPVTQPIHPTTPAPKSQGKRPQLEQSGSEDHKKKHKI
ncbi:uncharacterized protein LOC143620764 [Bidens hawaiensis]|uniref:uncharacterized protein LOC143620764 n=1 Tax=Bidens hawaiensis TaxID=980011 RepID=UPI00404B3B13